MKQQTFHIDEQNVFAHRACRLVISERNAEEELSCWDKAT